MSVRIRPDGRKNDYWCEFECGGRRISGYTGASTKRAAEKIEERWREDEKAKLAAAKKSGRTDVLTLEEACARYWSEVGQFLPDAQGKQLLGQLTWLQKHLGKTTVLQ